MKKEIDLRGLTCPEPVLRTKKLIDDESVSAIEALVDSEVNVQNLSRLAQSQKRTVSAARSVDQTHFIISITRPGVKTEIPTPTQVGHSHKTPNSPGRGGGLVVFIAKDTFGHGSGADDHDFSNNLLNVFLQTLEQAGHKPTAILMANSGVKLMDPSGPHAKVLNDFQTHGTKVLACGLCLDYYKLKDKVAVEQITNMFAICEYLIAADQVLSP